MTPLRSLHISDGRPGHYHLAEGVIAALARLRTVKTNTELIKRRRMVPGRYLRMLATADWCKPDTLLKMGYVGLIHYPPDDFLILFTRSLPTGEMWQPAQRNDALHAHRPVCGTLLCQVGDLSGTEFRRQFVVGYAVQHQPAFVG